MLVFDMERKDFDDFVKAFSTIIKDRIEKEVLYKEVDIEFEKMNFESFRGCKVSVDLKSIQEMAEKQGLLKLDKDGKMVPYTKKRHDSFLKKGDLMAGIFEQCDVVALVMDMVYGVKSDDDCLKRLNLKTNHQTDLPLIAVLEHEGIVKQVFPLHVEQGKMDCWRNSYKSWPWSWEVVDKIRDYYGNKIALYFAWMNHFTIWLVVPACFGVLLHVYNRSNENTMDTSMVAPLFSVFMIVWGALFVQFWKRKCAVLCCKWGNVCHLQMDHPRSDFQGELRLNVVNNRQERYFAHRYRCIRYLESMLVTTILLAVAFVVMIISLNFQGYIHKNTILGEMIVFPMVQQFSLPGCIFDQQGNGPFPYVLPFIPTIVHSLTILLLNTIYRDIATKLTNWENHKFDQDYENALILKRFIFEAFDCYIALFYLAFLQTDFQLVQLELQSLYMVDSIRRVFTESILPLLFYKYTTKSMTKHDAHTIHQESLLEPYEQFDDFMEMIIQFGYIVLFAAAFPLASIFSIFCNLIEVKSDLFKLTYVTQRPIVQRQDDIGIWLSILSTLVWLSVLTNVFLFGFTSEQLYLLMPSYYDIQGIDKDHTHVLALGKGRWVFGCILFLEHALIILLKLIFITVPQVPEKTQQQLSRQQILWHTSLASMKNKVA